MGVTCVTNVVYNKGRNTASKFPNVTKNRIEKKMSFGINGPTPKFGIQETQNMRNNGGGGNLGYFRRRKKDEKKKKDEIDIFQSSEDMDSFLLESDKDLKDNEGLLKKATTEFVNLFKKPRTSS